MMNTPLLFSLLLISFQYSINAQCPPSSPAIGCGLVNICCEGIEGFNSTLVTQSQLTEAFPGCDGAAVLNNDDWISFIAATETISIRIETSNCQSTGGTQGIQTGIFAGCDDTGGFNGDGAATDPLFVHCDCSTAPVTLTSNSFIIGNIYYLVIDGCGGDICDYEIEVLSGSTTSLEINELTGDIQGDEMVCAGEIVYFSVDTVENATYYSWQTGSQATIINGQGTIEIEVLIETEGNLDVCVEPINGCYQGNQNCISIISEGLANVDTLFTSICMGDSIEFEGDIYKESGFYSAQYNNVEGCDSILNLDLTVFEQYEINIDMAICEGESFEIGDSSYTQEGMYEYLFSTVEGCDSLISLNLQILPAFATSIDTALEHGGGFYNGVFYDTDTSIVENYIASNGCDSIINIDIAINPLGVALPPGIKSFTLLPNPASDKVYIQIGLDEALELRLDVFNVLGKKIDEFSFQSQLPRGNRNVEIRTKQLSVGTYFFHFQTKQGNFTKRLVITR
jgi:hypothetical protein